MACKRSAVRSRLPPPSKSKRREPSPVFFILNYSERLKLSEKIKDINGTVNNIHRKNVGQERNDWAEKMARSIRF